MATPSLAMIPSGYKASKVYSVLPESGVGDFDFTRATTATRVNSNGLIEEMAINVPRLNYPLIDGVVNGCPSLLLEPQRTNLITYSEDFSQGYWTKNGASVTSGFLSPDGTANAFKLVEDSANSEHFIQAQNISIVSDKYSFTMFAKASEITKLRVRGANYFTNIAGADFDLTSKTATNLSTGIDAKIVEMGNGWFKCTFTSLDNGFVGSNGHFRVYLLDDTGSTSYTGDGTSGVYIWGAMLEQGSYPTSYIPTNGSSVTRNAETCNGAGDAATFNDSEGVLMAEISALGNSQIYKLISISDGTNNNRVTLGYNNSAINKFYFQLKANSSSIWSLNIEKNINVSKIAFKYKSGQQSVFVDGFEVVNKTDAFTFSSNLSDLSFLEQGTSNPFYGKTKEIAYYNSALTDSELETLTSWTSFSDMANGQQYSII